MPKTVMVRARPETRDLLAELARQEQASAIDTLDTLVREAHERRLLAAVERELTTHASEITADVTTWDHALQDGLDPREDFSG